MKKSVDILIWALLLFLITPSGMALASWNSTPGDAVYPWKLALEKVLLLVVSPSDKLQSTAQVKITERRFAEVEQTLESEYAIEGLENLNRQLAATSTNIQKIDKSTARTEANKQYLASLKKMSATLNEQKTKAKTGQIAVVAQKNTNTGFTTNTTKSSSGTYNVYNIYNVRPTTTRTSSNPNSANNVPANNTQNNVPTSAATPTSAPTAIAETGSTPTNNADDVINAIEETEDAVNQTIEILEQIQSMGLDEEGNGNNGQGNGLNLNQINNNDDENRPNLNLNDGDGLTQEQIQMIQQNNNDDEDNNRNGNNNGGAGINSAPGSYNNLPEIN